MIVSWNASKKSVKRFFPNSAKISILHNRKTIHIRLYYVFEMKRVLDNRVILLSKAPNESFIQELNFLLKADYPDSGARMLLEKFLVLPPCTYTKKNVQDYLPLITLFIICFFKVLAYFSPSFPTWVIFYVFMHILVAFLSLKMHNDVVSAPDLKMSCFFESFEFQKRWNPSLSMYLERKWCHKLFGSNGYLCLVWLSAYTYSTCVYLFNSWQYYCSSGLFCFCYCTTPVAYSFIWRFTAN